MIFLASPYSHRNQDIVEKRVVATEAFVIHHLRHGVPLFSPVVYCHQLSKTYELPTDASYWTAFNYSMLTSAEEMWVLCLPGWEMSKGVKMEMDSAKAAGIPIRMRTV